MHDPGLFALGLGITAIVLVAVGIVAAGVLAHRREERLMDELMFEALLERARDSDAERYGGAEPDATAAPRRAAADRGD